MATSRQIRVSTRPDMLESPSATIQVCFVTMYKACLELESSDQLAEFLSKLEMAKLAFQAVTALQEEVLENGQERLF